MSRAYARHIAREESDLIPLAARTFDAATLAAIGREMAARRGVAPDALRGGLTGACRSARTRPHITTPAPRPACEPAP